MTTRRVTAPGATGAGFEASAMPKRITPLSRCAVLAIGEEGRNDAAERGAGEPAGDGGCFDPAHSLDMRTPRSA